MGSWDITMRDSDYGFELLETIVVSQLWQVGFATFHLAVALQVIKADIMEEVRKANHGCPVGLFVHYFSKTFPERFTEGALLIAECFDDFYRTGELVVTDYIGENCDPVDRHIKEIIVTPADLNILLGELQSVQNPEHWKYQSWIRDSDRKRWLAHIQSVYQPLKDHAYIKRPKHGRLTNGACGGR